MDGKDEATGRFIDGNPGGGPKGKYKEQYAEEVYKLCLLGATDDDIADFFGVMRSTIFRWVDDHPDFGEQRRAGKHIADANVADSIYQSAIGFSHVEDHITNYQGQIIITPTIKRYPPNTSAGQFWLKNRQPHLWRDKKEIDHSGQLTINQLLDQIDGTHTGLPPDEQDIAA